MTARRKINETKIFFVFISHFVFIEKYFQTKCSWGEMISESGISFRGWEFYFFEVVLPSKNYLFIK